MSKTKEDPNTTEILEPLLADVLMSCIIHQQIPPRL